MEIIVCIIVLLLAFFIYKDYLKVAQEVQEIQTIVQDDSHRYYVICPGCGRKIVLTDVQILVLEDKYNKGEKK